MLENKKAQVNVEFIVAVLLLTVVIISTVLLVIRILPGFDESLNEANLRSKATALEKVLLYEPGVPPNWTATPVVIGLAAFNNYSNMTLLGALDPIKLTYLNSSDTVNYSALKANLNLSNTIDFYLTISSTWGVIKYFNYTYAKTDRVVSVTKFMTINKTEANVTLLVW